MSEGTPPPGNADRSEATPLSPPPASPPPTSEPPTVGGYGVAPPPPPATHAGPRPGELLERFLARLIDHILIGVVNATIISVLVVGLIGLDGATAFGYGRSFAAAAVSAVISVALGLAYFAWMESSQGRTLGKMALKLHVQDAAGNHPTFEESIKRNWWLAIGLVGIIPVVGFLGGLASLVVVIVIAVQLNNDPEHRPALTDRFADTAVVKEG